MTMKSKIGPLFIIILSSLFFSCTKTEDGESNGYFRDLEPLIDMSQTNQYNESLLCNTWILSKVIRETYVDGVLVDSEDETESWSKMEYTFRKDHSMSYGGSNGRWLYTHNHLIWKCPGGYVYEVTKAGLGVLHLKQEVYPDGGSFTPFLKDKSGKHYFWVFQYKAK